MESQALARNTTAAAQAKRQKQSAIVCRMMLTILKAAHKNFHTKHLGAMFEEYLVGMALAQAEGVPMTIAEIARVLNMPRSNVRRGLDALIGFGMCLRVERTFTINPAYYAERVDVDYILTIQEAIAVAARELAKMDSRPPATIAGRFIKRM